MLLRLNSENPRGLAGLSAMMPRRRCVLRTNAQKECGTFVATVRADDRVGVRRCMIRLGLGTIRLGSREHCSFALSNSRETHVSYYNKQFYQYSYFLVYLQPKNLFQRGSVTLIFH